MATEAGFDRKSRLCACLLIAMLAALAATGCGGSSDEQAQQRSSGAQEGSLPAPERAPRGVTGMPALPGPGEIGPPDGSSSDAMLPGDTGQDVSAGTGAEQMDGIDPATQPLAPDLLHPAAPQSGAIEPGGQAADEPGRREATAVVRDYYAALGNGDFARAYRLWSDDGAASSRSPEQFAESFSGTASWSLEILAPERSDAGRPRYIEVPVAIEELHQDGSVRRQIGAYTLRRVTVEERGAQRPTWRISSADLREVRP